MSSSSMKEPTDTTTVPADTSDNDGDPPPIQPAADEPIQTTDEFADNDEFGDFDDFGTPVDDEAFDDFNDFDNSVPIENDVQEPTQMEEYIDLLTRSSQQDAVAFLESFLKTTWSINSDENTATPQPNSTILCTECSHDLWDKLSRDAVFYNPVTGAVGQFQWNRSETSRAYLRAMGVTINYEERPMSNGSLPSSPNGQHKRPQSSYPDKNSGSPPGDRRTFTNHTRSTSLSGMTSTNGHSYENDQTPQNEPAAEPEPELDIDIARAYCELTEETIHIFPDERLSLMVTELTRLQRQASEYLSYLLDQREQLMMDAETYNDLISCIVGHAQRLREQNTSKDASPAMVSKKKKSSGLSMLRRKQNSTHSSASMGGGVVGVKQTKRSASASAAVPEGRRSL